ncbi:hypothetical protein Pla111_29970 [Botrimarina hoheduenensis]|uniref:SGNH hydrolase-type esterase domain-containing protein n=2 Tax=Botrimarina hoheduenensis TaxID=2528000 RepID=A0A5C5VTG3_9BACT|nr:hypothetical protein Pla111_29970 [Botrimarina hoheduenensis]
MLAQCWLLLASLVAWADLPTPPDFTPYRAEIAGWESDISKLEAIREPTPHRDSILVVGSSSIRLWESVDADLAPYRVIRRGYGGAKYSDLAYYLPRLIEPHAYRAAVVFVGNDITGGAGDKSPAELGEWFGYVADRLHHHEPEAQVLCVDVRPTPLRFQAWSDIAAGNAALKHACEKRDRTHYVDTSNHFLTEDGQSVKLSLYREDNLHLSAEGYAVWSEQIVRALDRVLSASEP